uniref:Uncharacterized protein n=1 Tax=Theropithecus gelada TaxID=9565 RepID=A0A8D2ED39_THEGE
MTIPLCQIRLSTTQLRHSGYLDFVSIQGKPWCPHIHSPSQHLSSSPDLLL